MQITLKTRRYGELEFRSMHSGGYVWVRNPITGHWEQPCRKGRLSHGSTLTASESTLPHVAATWWRQRLRWARNEHTTAF